MCNTSVAGHSNIGLASDHPVFTPSPSTVQGGVKEHSMGKFLLVVSLFSPDGTADAVEESFHLTFATFLIPVLHSVYVPGHSLSETKMCLAKMDIETCVFITTTEITSV